MRKVIRSIKDVNREQIVYFKQISSDPLIQLKKYAGTFTGVGPGIDSNANPVTGLHEPYTVGSSKAKNKGSRQEMEDLLSLPEGTLKPRSPYWITFQVKADGEPVRLDLRDDTHLLKFLVLRAQSIVADGYEELNTNPRAEYVLYSEEQEAALKVESRQALKEAYRKADELDIETKINILSVYGIIADSTRPNTINSKIDEALEQNPEKFLKVLKDDGLVQLSLIAKSLNAGILSMQDGAVYHGEIVVGYSKQDAASKLVKDKKLEKILRAKLSGDLEIIQEAFKSEK